jgi:hypothetical protein
MQVLKVFPFFCFFNFSGCFFVRCLGRLFVFRLVLLTDLISAQRAPKVLKFPSLEFPRTFLTFLSRIFSSNFSDCFPKYFPPSIHKTPTKKKLIKKMSLPIYFNFSSQKARQTFLNVPGVN